jgi:membrane peptidoglycan carboxypeptidase
MAAQKRHLKLALFRLATTAWALFFAALTPVYAATPDNAQSARLNRANTPDEPPTLRGMWRQMGGSEETKFARVDGSTTAKAPKSRGLPLEPAPVQRTYSGRYLLTEMPNFSTKAAGRIMGIAPNDELVSYSLNPDLQAYVSDLVKRAGAPHVAVVVMEPATGRILAVADRSTSNLELSLHAGFPAASIFKIVTSAAALEQGGVNPDSPVAFRGGTYTLERWNYLPNPKTDRRSMSLSEALGRSCNPVFARVALSKLNPQVLENYARAFGFNQELATDIAVPRSDAEIPTNDSFLIGRTAAGFGDVKLSPVHGAALISGVANGGILPRPYIIDAVYSGDGELLYESSPQAAGRLVDTDTATRLLEMMQYTTTIGTSRKEFLPRSGSVMNNMPVAAKTGTLRGNNPKGLNHWFLAAAPANNPQVAVSVISVDPTRTSGKAAFIGRSVLERFFGNPNPPPAYEPKKSSSKKKSSTSSKSKKKNTTNKK